MASFADLFMKLREEENPEDIRDTGQETEDTSLMGSEIDPTTVTGEDSNGEEAIRLGINIRPDFWDDFIKISNNADSLSRLLGIDADKISDWPRRVKESLEKVTQEDKSLPSVRKQVISTGEGGRDDENI